jgi:hypothetical protein
MLERMRAVKKHDRGTGVGLPERASGWTGWASRAAFVALATLAGASTGCASVSSSGVATGPFAGPPRSGPVAIFMGNRPPPGTREVGLVEARGSGDNDGVDALFPELVQRVQELGGNAVLIEWIGPRFDVTPYYPAYTMMPCGRGPCMGATMTSQPMEVMTVVMRGRALLLPTDTPAPETSAPTPASPAPPASPSPTSPEAAGAEP